MRGSVATHGMKPRVLSGSVRGALSEISAQDSAGIASIDDIDEEDMITLRFDPFNVGVLFNTANNRVYALKPGEQGEKLNVGVGWRLLRMDNEPITAKGAIMRIPTLRDSKQKFTMTFARERLDPTEAENLKKIEKQIEVQLKDRSKKSRAEKPSIVAGETVPGSAAASQTAPSDQGEQAEQTTEEPAAEAKPSCMGKVKELVSLDGEYFAVSVDWPSVPPDTDPASGMRRSFFSYHSLFGFDKTGFSKRHPNATPGPVAA
jgi:hypothetical protein